MKPPSRSRASSASSFPSFEAAFNSLHQEGDVPQPYATGTDEDMAASIAAIESLLGYTFRDRQLAEKALTHPSAHLGISYESLEVVGDGALGLIVTEHLLLTYPDADPGRRITRFTTLRAANVSTEKLARVALRHGLYRHLRRRAPMQLDAQVAEFAAAVEREEDQDAELAAIYGGALVKAPKVLADVVKSVVAAVCVDTGMDMGVMRLACLVLLEPIITADTFHEQPVSVLNKLSQQRGWSLDFKSWRKEDRTVVNAFVNGDLVGIGSADQKHLAKLNAARHALQELSLAILEAVAEEELVGGTYSGGKEEPEVAGEVSAVKRNPLVVDGEGPEEVVEAAEMKLNIICEKNHWPPPVYSTDWEMGPPHLRRYICSVRVEAPEGVCEESGVRLREKEAENAAASKMIKALMNGCSIDPSR